MRARICIWLLMIGDYPFKIQRAMAPGLLDSDFLGLQTLESVMRVSRTWDSIISLIPKEGETIWDNLDWSPKEGHVCDSETKKYNNGKNENNTKGGTSFRVQELTKYGRIISFGKASLDLPSSQLPVIGSEKQEFVHGDSSPNSYSSCGEYWSNPLETKLPDAPDMEIYCLYGLEFLPKDLTCTNYHHLVGARPFLFKLIAQQMEVTMDA
ncbi:phospholipid:diacylglycerol acyltransferase 2 [Olea europaea subsp. europaea]|uniref:Phospholipid:diacylglycerol acyltransferase 2 n=1 Tax=Olea europaea subsp. europaea TaxID=158383 RepID=A0A8S0RKE8_OLEEU|nr:phospholipid:diacylglycerol acyltransferase 2 [Olea europaea subsp. europaea]